MDATLETNLPEVSKQLESELIRPIPQRKRRKARELPDGVTEATRVACSVDA